MIEGADVVVVGAGPVGLMLAIELALAGARPLVLERLEAPSTVMKALGIGPLGCEALERRGMGPAIAAGEASTFAAMQALASQPGAAARGKGSKFSGHFAGLSLIRKDAQREPQRHARPVDQQGVEAMLGERARVLGVEVRRGVEVTGLDERDGGVDVDWTSASGAGRTRGAWLVACDGGRSAIRRQAGFAFPGTPPSTTFYQAVVELDHPERLLPLGWRRTDGGVYSYGFLPGRLVLLDFSGPPADRDAPVTREEIESVLCRISGRDVRVAALGAANRWTDNTRLADTYRRGRVLLAGDAAHIHTPFGGQGLSLGLVDAANLGWKLAAVARGAMPESLLDSYTDERRPVAEAVLANTLAQAAIMRPDPQAGAMRALVAKLMDFDDVNRFIGEAMTGLGTRYDLGSNHDDVGRLAGDRPVGESSLFELMQDGRGVLLDATAGQLATALVSGATARVRCVAVESGPSMLIRPDACIAWVGDQGGVAGLAEALERWFGTPAMRRATAPRD